MKLSAVSGVVKGKRVVMIDDSIVRGTTSRRIVNLLKEAGATEVFTIGLNDEEGLEAIKKRLVTNES